MPKIRRLFWGVCAVPALLGQPLSVSASEPPAVIMEEVEQAFATCQGAGGHGRILPGYHSSADLNDDGVTDFITDKGRIECAQAWDVFCRSDGCPVTVWLSEPGGRYVKNDLGNLLRVEITTDGEHRPAVRAFYHDSLCEQSTVEAALCTRLWVFDSNSPDTPEFELPQATAPSHRPLSGEGLPDAGEEMKWSVRHLPGASPVALTPGPGNVYNMAVFCLSDLPFLAIRFRTAVEEENLTVRFGFESGGIEVDAGFEETAGNAHVIDLSNNDLARTLAGASTEVSISVSGLDEGILSLAGSTRSIRAALESCHRF